MAQSSQMANVRSRLKFAQRVTPESVSQVKIGHMRQAARKPFYLKEWRKHRSLTQQQLADRLDVTKGYISELERGIKRYNQDVLEALAEALVCLPADLLNRDPSEPDSIWDIWPNLTDSQRAQALAIIKALRTVI